MQPIYGPIDFTSVLQQLGIALGLGLLVGLQRESVSTQLAGLRTFPLVTVLGTICALLAQVFGGLVVAAGFVAVAAMVIVGNVAELKAGRNDPGLTTEFAVLLMFGVGAYLVMGYRGIAIAIGGGVAFLLQFKGELHGVAARLGDKDLKAIMQFALVSLVILPVLPNRAYGPYAVLNPRQVWLMVVLIVGISLSGYIVYKFWGEKAGLVLGGVLGGIISSTATAVSYARRTAGKPEGSAPAALVIIVAESVVPIRLLVEIAVVAPAFLLVAGPPILSMLALFATLSLGLWFWGRREKGELPEPKNPAALKSALLFGLVYALVLFAVAAAKERFGQQGMYVVAGLSGFTGMSAITLSTAQLVGSSRLDADIGWRLIILALSANMIFKAATIAVIGHRQLLARVGLLYAIALAAGVLLLLLWPHAG